MPRGGVLSPAPVGCWGRRACRRRRGPCRRCTRPNGDPRRRRTLCLGTSEVGRACVAPLDDERMVLDSRVRRGDLVIRGLARPSDNMGHLEAGRDKAGRSHEAQKPNAAEPPRQTRRSAELRPGRVQAILDGTQAAPQGRSRADVALIPNIPSACMAGDFRPITVLPILLKASMRCWMLHAGPWLALRRPASHGFRPGFQAAEVHFLARALQRKHAELGMRLVTAKLDIKQAYDTLAWGSIQALFERRGLPVALQHAYGRMPRGRRLTFRTADGSTTVEVEPSQGIPQGSPESPMVYAAVLEMLLEDAEAQFRRHGWPCGVDLHNADTQQ